ncbi:quinone oxidoreductase family protein [Sanyastnella coralliicola]|uniref:quinone oxidoreductase family protein n=1 Tax=Sanyastnella coralliicola TaxID=3069118 RepID=UPI0027BB1620|nr:zinc-binding dehydrogenase [Longitalea sp. SCSIO 12813]
MKAAVLTTNGNAFDSFEIRDLDKPTPQEGQVLIKVEAFGLNFADVMARRGLYREAPPLPSVIGYDLVGKVEAVGSGVDTSLIGERVAGMSRFGSYAEYCATQASGVAVVPDDMPAAEACALGTQYCTAWYAAFQATNMNPGERVLIHAAAGGVGTALVQLAQWKGCEIFATAGSDEKIQLLKDRGVQHVINYRTQDYEEEIKKILGEKRLDMTFNAIAGSTFKKDMRLIGAGGRVVIYGAAERAGKKGGKWATINMLRKMGLLIPLLRMAKSQALIGVNMLKIADHRPQRIAEALEELVKLYQEGVIKPQSGGEYSVNELAQAHDDLEYRRTTGKLAVRW